MRGLSSYDVDESRKKHGSNVIPDSEPTTFWGEMKESFKDPMIQILIVIAFIYIGMYFLGYAEIYEPIGTIVAILIVSFVTAKTGVANDTKYRELKAKTEKDKCKVYRDGFITEIDIDDVVVGDEVLLQAGDKVPADGILISGSLKVDNSALNGEAEECKKTAAPDGFQIPDEITGDTFVDAHSVFRGAIACDGEGVVRICKVGLSTMMGKMAEEMQGKEPDSPLKVKLAKLAKQISTFGYIGAGVITVLYLASFVIAAGGFAEFFATGGPNVFKSVINAVSIALVIIVCAVPEGLPLTIALVLMQNTGRMLDHNVLVRKSIGIETAGSLNILFSDKTGTITKGKLEVVEFFDGSGSVISNMHSKVQEALRTDICQNTNAMYDKDHKLIGGNATDRACLGYLGEEVYLKTIQDENNAVTAEQGFNSANKFSQAYIKTHGRTYYKGAPERLLAKAKSYMDKDGNIVPIDIAVINRKIDELAGRAMRVLAFGYSEKELEENVIHDDLVIIGFVAIRDDVRPEAVSAIKEVQDAGIQVVMITGDRKETAVAIASDAGLYKDTSDVALTSEELNRMSDDEIKEILPNLRVIARALPTDKSRMVRIAQSLNLVVGMTGDGVNDSPALKQADVGFAMGSGTEAAKEAGKIVILDDNFLSLKDAIWYGRTIYHNILKFCKFQLAINFAAVIINCIFPFLGVGQPLTVTHLLFVNLVMDSLGSLLISGEPAKESYMKEKPRKRDENIISKGLAVQVGVAAAWMIVLSIIFLKVPFFETLFASKEEHLTAYFALFIWTAMMNAWNIRDEGFRIFNRLSENKNFVRIMALILVIQCLIINAALVPLPAFAFIGKMFSCTPFGLAGWVVVIALSVTIVPVDFIRKIFVKKR